jgi:nitrate reductase NapE component
MKKLIIIFVLIPLLSIAQEVQKVEVIKSDTQIENLNKLLGQNEIKIDFLDFVLFPALTVGYEKSRNSSTAFGATMFINFNGDIGNDWNDKFTITPYYRFYFLESQDYGGYGVFAEIFGKLTFGENEYYDNISPNLVSDSYFDIAPGLAVGRKWINRKGFTFELMFGVGRNLLYDEKDSNRSSGTVRAGISIGKRF